MPLAAEGMRADDSVSSVPTEPTVPATPTAGSPLAWPVQQVTLVSARLGVALTTLPTGASVLVPTYELADADGLDVERDRRGRRPAGLLRLAPRLPETSTKAGRRRRDVDRPSSCRDLTVENAMGRVVGPHSVTHGVLAAAERDAGRPLAHPSSLVADRLSAMGERSEKLLLLDTASLYFRAYFGVPDSVKAPDGTPVNANRGLLDMIATAGHRTTGRRGWSCAGTTTGARSSGWTRSRRTRRTAWRSRCPARRAPRRSRTPWRRRSRSSWRCSRRSASRGSVSPGYEADDVIGTLVAREVAKENPAPVEVITGDRDLFQLVDDTIPVRVLYTIRGIRDLMAIDQARAEGEVRGPVGTGVRGHGRAARRPERRPAGGAGDRGEDGRASRSTATARWWGSWPRATPATQG